MSNAQKSIYWITSIGALALTLSAMAAPVVNQTELKKAMKILEETASSGEDASASFSMTKVKGETTKEMLRDYAEKNNYEMDDLQIFLNMSADQIPEAESGDNTIGLGKNVDLASLAVDLYMNVTRDKDRKVLKSKALDALFQVTGAGALVGVESYGWIVCGAHVPALIILDPSRKVIYALVPDDTGC
jgi:hypothetical protein